MCIYVCEHVSVIVYLWRSEDHLRKQVFFSTLWSLGIELRLSGLSKVPSPAEPSHWPRLCVVMFNVPLKVNL